MKAASIIGEPTILSPRNVAALSGLGAWWISELLHLLPKKWVQRQVVWLSFDDGVLSLLRRRGRKLAPIATAPLELLDKRAGRRLRRKLRRLAAKNAEFWIAVDEKRVLRRRVSLPKAAASHLREALTLQLVEDSPFELSEVAFDHRVSKAGGDGETIAVEQIIVPTAFIAEAERIASSIGVGLNGVRPISDIGSSDGGGRVNLLPKSMRPHFSPWPGRLNAALAVVCLALMAALGVSEAGRAERVAGARETQLVALKAEAEQTFAERARLDRMRDELLAAQRIAEGRLSLTELMEQLAERLPDDAWLVELRLAEGGCTIFGYASSAAKLILALQSSPYVEEARFSSPTTFDARAGAEKFYIAITLSKGLQRLTAETGLRPGEGGGRL